LHSTQALPVAVDFERLARIYVAKIRMLLLKFQHNLSERASETL